jgi:hypothetical protein
VGFWKAFKEETHWLAAGVIPTVRVGGSGAGREIAHGRGWIARDEEFGRPFR